MSHNTLNYLQTLWSFKAIECHWNELTGWFIELIVSILLTSQKQLLFKHHKYPTVKVYNSFKFEFDFDFNRTTRLYPSLEHCLVQKGLVKCAINKEYYALFITPIKIKTGTTTKSVFFKFIVFIFLLFLLAFFQPSGWYWAEE